MRLVVSTRTGDENASHVPLAGSNKTTRGSGLLLSVIRLPGKHPEKAPASRHQSADRFSNSCCASPRGFRVSRYRTIGASALSKAVLPNATPDYQILTPLFFAKKHYPFLSPPKQGSVCLY
jgi:hypothetical protein